MTDKLVTEAYLRIFGRRVPPVFVCMDILNTLAEEAYKLALEDAAKKVCRDCRNNKPFLEGTYRHVFPNGRTFECRAIPIHRALKADG